jgi:hypothetical protein
MSLYEDVLKLLCETREVVEFQDFCHLSNIGPKSYDNPNTTAISTFFSDRDVVCELLRIKYRSAFYVFCLHEERKEGR